MMTYRPQAYAPQRSAASPLLALLAAVALAVALLPALAGAQGDDPVTPARVDGQTRFHTAANLATLSFESADVAHLAFAGDFPDALAASYAAGVVDGPVLLTPSDEVGADSPTMQALEALDVRRVVLVGGEAVISPAVEEELADRGYDTDRVAGVNRYQTAASVALRYGRDGEVGTLDGDRTALIASGESFPDALAAGPVAARAAFPLLLTPPDAAGEAATNSALQQLEIDRLVVVGGSAAVSGDVVRSFQARGYHVERWGGATRTETAAVVADNAVERLGFDVNLSLLARGDDFPDALAASVHGGVRAAPILLTADPTTLSESTRRWLAAACPDVRAIRAIGGTTAVSDAVLDDAVDAAGSCRGDGRWTALPHALIEPRLNHTATWTGDRMIVWGGGDASGVHADGAAWDPHAQEWRAIPAAPIEPRWAHEAAWTGDELVVWGGSEGPDHLARCFVDGAAYDPVTGTWRVLPDAPGEGRCGATSVWTGAVLMVYGGVPGGGPPQPGDYHADAIAYDPVADAWRDVPAPSITPRTGAVSAWTGTEMIVYGGTGPDFEPLDDGAGYDATTDAWRPIADSPLAARSDVTGVWTGAELIVFGGRDLGTGDDATEAAAYDPDLDTWRTLADLPARHTAPTPSVWTGDVVYVVGGYTPQADAPSFHAYVAEHDAWVERPDPPDTPRVNHTAVWTGTQLIVWGGEQRPRGGAADGAAWTPPTG